MAAKLWMMSIQGTVLIGVVLVLRMLMRRYPKKYSYMLWLLVLVRLLCPVFIESDVSLQPDLQHYVSGGEILFCETEVLTKEDFVESFRAPDIAWEDDMIQYEIVDAYDEPYGQHCFLLTNEKILIYLDGAFFLAEKE